MPFVKGKRHPNQGGKRTAAGRKSNRQKANEAEALAEFKRTGRVNKTIAKYLDKDTLELLTEAQRLCRKLDRGKLSDRELCRFIDRLVPPAKQQIDVNLTSLAAHVPASRPITLNRARKAAKSGCLGAEKSTENQR